MNKSDIEVYLEHLKQQYNVRVYTPFKYFKGLSTKKDVKSRFLDITRGSKSDYRQHASYRKFETDNNRTTKKSRYTTAFEESYGADKKSLRDKSLVTGIPLDILEKVYNKGKAAWRTGHRVGATEEQWGYARVHSFIMFGCTTFGPDLHLFQEAVQRMSPSKLRQWLCRSKTQCPSSTLEKPFYRSRNGTQIINQSKKKFCDGHK